MDNHHQLLLFTSHSLIPNSFLFSIPSFSPTPMAPHTNTADSLERSLRSLSIHDSGGRCGARTTTTQALANWKSETDCRQQQQQDLITLDLNSETSLPYNWEQCLDLKTAEIYFINRSNGMKTREDPREMPEYRVEYYYSADEEDADDDDDDNGSCDYETDEEGCVSNGVKGAEENVLVAAGCTSCLMYYMVPKQVNDCPKCNRQLLHFDQLEKSSSLAPV